jgi:uncharacterized protein
MTRTIIVSLLLALLAGVEAEAVSVEAIPDPRPASWSVDLTGKVPIETLQLIDRVGDEARTQAGAEITVVAVGSVGGVDPREFANRLFNAWGIGDRARNNGVLVLAALDDHAVEIVLGSGIDGERNEQVSAEIIQSEMVPRFRAGDPGGALLAGASACARRILEAPSGQGQTQARTSPQPLVRQAPSPDFQESHGPPGWLWALSGITVLGAGLYGFLRFRPRNCPDCQTRMVRLDETADDEHLNAAERTEEQVGSVDYDIWCCESCGKIAKSRFGAWLTSYSSCTACGAKTAGRVTETLRSATYDHEGLVRVTKTCAFCSHQEVGTHTTSRLVRPTPSSSRTFSSSSSSSYSSSSSSSSGSGVGGGSSRGGGASGQW